MINDYTSIINEDTIKKLLTTDKNAKTIFWLNICGNCMFKVYLISENFVKFYKLNISRDNF